MMLKSKCIRTYTKMQSYRIFNKNNYKLMSKELSPILYHN